MSAQEVTCIICPVGCKIKVEKDPGAELGYKLEGNECKRGINYAIEEVTDPRRNLATTVVIERAHLPRLPVKTSIPIPKDKIFDCMREINNVKVEAPVKIGKVLIKNVLQTGSDIVATRSMNEMSN